MPLSLEKIRELNKVSLYVTCCSDPCPAFGSSLPTVSGDSGLKGSGVRVSDPWVLGMYSSGGFPLSSGVEYGDRVDDAIKAMGSDGPFWSHGFFKALGMGLQQGWGLMPQLDYAHKMYLKSSAPLKFSLKCYLCLETSVYDDFLRPLSQLFFLTYPTRSSDSDALTTLVDKASDGVRKLGEWSSEMRSSYSSKLPASGVGEASGVGGSESGGVYVWWDRFMQSLFSVGELSAGAVEEGLSWLKETAIPWLNHALGDGLYLLYCPPTCRSLWFAGSGSREVTYGGNTVYYYDVVGSGLLVKYGSVVVPDCVITSLNIDIPKLYYRGGYPGLIEVELGFQTLRVGTSNLLRDTVHGVGLG